MPFTSGATAARSSAVSLRKTRGGDRARSRVVAEDVGDPLGDLTVPRRRRQEVAAGRGAVHGTQLDEGIGALVDCLEHPEAVAEIRDLEHRRTGFGVEDTEAVDDVLIGAGDDALLRVGVVAQHGERSGRPRGNDPAEQARLGQLLHDGAPIVHVGQRPPPQVRHPSDRAGVLRCHSLRCELCGVCHQLPLWARNRRTAAGVAACADPARAAKYSWRSNVGDHPAGVKGADQPVWRGAYALLGFARDMVMIGMPSMSESLPGTTAKPWRR